MFLFAGPGVPVGRLRNLVMGLPQGSVTSGQWQLTDQLLAVNAEVADQQLRAFLHAHSKKGARMPEPLRIDWPGRRDATTTPPAAPSPKESIVEFFAGATRVIAKGDADGA